MAAMTRSLVAIGILLMLLRPAAVSAAEADEKVARAALADVPPIIDGRLDDAVWLNAPAHGGFVERTPRLRDKPAEDTTFRLLADGDALYVGITCFDSEPAAIRARTLQRDSDAIFDDDAVTVKIDPMRDGRTTLGFALNAAGGRMDYRGLNESTWQIEVDLVWDGAAMRTDLGWEAELRIPWAALGIDPTSPPTLTGLDISRDHSRRNATYDWALIVPPHQPIAASQYGLLQGLPELLAHAPTSSTRKTWALIPWALVGYEHAPGRAIEPLANAGLDIETELGNGFAATLTLNTDFAQVEVDDVVTNLGRFDLFIPEKRDFFLKDGDLFSFGEPGWATLFHSRTIGLAQTEAGTTEVPIVAGAKVGGRTGGGIRLGALSVLTRPRAGLPWRLDSALRLQQAFRDGSAVGFMATHRQSLDAADERNVTFGLDSSWHAVGVPFVLDVFAAGSLDDQPGRTSAADAALFVHAQWRGEVFSPTLAYAYFGPQFRPALGYFERTGVHNLWTFDPVQVRIGAASLEKLELWAETDIYLDAPGAELLDWRQELGGLLSWDAGFWLRVSGKLAEETVDAFAVAGRYEVAAGVHGRDAVRVGAGTPSTEVISLEVNSTYGEYFGGTIATLLGRLIARPGTWLRVQLTADASWVSLPSGDFSAPTVNLRLASGLTSDLELSGFVGWSGLASELSFQTRLRWSFAPGSDLFGVWELALDDDTGAAGVHSLIVKIALRWP